MRAARRNLLDCVVCVATGCVLAAVLMLLVAGQSALQTYYANRSLLSNAVLWPLALLCMTGLMALRAWLDGREPAGKSVRGPWLTRGLFTALLAAQLVVVRAAWFKMGWDVADVYTAAEALARGQAISNAEYFRLCPNNAPLAVLQALPMWAAVKLGLVEPFIVLPMLDAVLLNLTAYACVSCSRVLVKSKVAQGFVAALAVGWIALSPFMLYPYTDTWSILFPVLGLCAWLRVKRPAPRWLLASLMCFAGAAIKPTVLIPLVAMALMSGAHWLIRRDFRAAAWRRVGAAVLALALGAVPGMLYQNLTTEYLAGSAKPEEQLSMTHYLMLGMNGETHGGHSPDDVAFSQSYPTLAQRQPANLKRAWERVAEKGLWGNVRFFAVKAFKAYADGSFAAQHSMLEVEVPRRSDPISAAVRSVYHRRGALNQAWDTAAQLVWLLVLTLCAVAAFIRRREPAAAVLCLTLLGATAYLLLFEVWPRYLFVFAPFYLLLAGMGLDTPLRRKA